MTIDSFCKKKKNSPDRVVQECGHKLLGFLVSWHILPNSDVSLSDVLTASCRFPFLRTMSNSGAHGTS